MNGEKNNTSTIEPGHEILEVKILLHEDYHTFVVMLGLDECGKNGGHWYRDVPPKDSLAVLHGLLAEGSLGDQWSRGKPLMSPVCGRDARKIRGAA